jgi:hypothetical protein
MSNQFYTFAYDPVRQGYDSNTWNTILGVPVVINNQLTFKAAGAQHFADILRGDAIFNISISAPAAGDDIQVGFMGQNGASYAYFNIVDDVLTAETSDGVTTKTVTIPWSTAWSNTNTEFGIKWETGLVTFSIGGQYQAKIGETSTLDVPTSTVPGDPMSLYIYSNSTNPLSLKYIDIKSIQSLIWS